MSKQKTILIAVISLISAGAGSGAAAGTSPSRSETAQKAFFGFASCVTAAEPGFIRIILNKEPWGPRKFELLKKVAYRNAICGEFDEMSFNPQLFLNTLAGSMFVHDHLGRKLPDYTSVPRHITSGAVQAAPPGEQQQALAFAAFAECVFRHKPEETRTLLGSRPATREENIAWQALDETLGACLPTEPGTAIKFSRVGLRGLLGTAAYRSDQTLEDEVAKAKN